MTANPPFIKPDLVLTIQNEGFEPKRKGRSFWLSCPFHEDKTPSLKIDSERQAFYCFGCNVGGDVITFIQKLHGLSFQDALKHLRLDGSTKINPKEKTKRELLKSFKTWERDYYRQLAEFYHLFHDITKDFKTMEEVEEYADGFHLIPIVEWYMDILFQGSDEQKYNLFRFIKGK